MEILLPWLSNFFQGNLKSSEMSASVTNLFVNILMFVVYIFILLTSIHRFIRIYLTLHRVDNRKFADGSSYHYFRYIL